MSITATCLTIAAVLAAAQGGETIYLKGNCPTMTIAKDYSREVTIEAEGSTVQSLVITGSNIRWHRGRLTAKDGPHGAGGNHSHAATLQTAQRVTFDGVTFTDARRGVVIDQSEDVMVLNSVFSRIGEDGAMIARSKRLRFDRNRFELSNPKLAECTLGPGSVRVGISPQVCTSLGGSWRDGYHPDALQMFNDVQDILISRNVVRGEVTQGIAQMDSGAMLPLQRVSIIGNSVITGGAHPITLGKNCVDCRIEHNEVRRWPGSTFKKMIIAGSARRCGNQVDDEKAQDRPCKD